MSPKLRQGLWALLAVGFFAACLMLVGRVRREEMNQKVELVFDYAALRDLARAQGEPLDLKKYGTSFSVAELKLDDLENQGVAVGLEGLQLQIMQGQTPSETLIDPSKTYLRFYKPESIDSIEAALKLALGDKKVRRLGDGPVLELDVDMRVLPTLGLGFPADLISDLNKQGFRVWLRPENKPLADPVTIKKTYEGLEKLPGVAGVIFGGATNEAVGYLQGLDEAVAQLKRLGWKVGLIELAPGAQQKGIEYLVRHLQDQTTRVFAVSPAQQEKLPPDRVIGMFSLAARERNLRVLYVRPYTYDPSPDKGMEHANDELFAGIRKETQGMEGPASVFEEQWAWKPNFLLLALVAAGAGAATWLLLAELWPGLPPSVRQRWPEVPFVLGALIVGGLAVLTGASAFLGPKGQLWRSAMALGTGSVMPTLAMVAHFGFLERAGTKSGKQAFLGGFFLLLRTSALSLAGALMAASYLGETTYMLGLDTFRGVKVLTLGVPILVVLAWLLREGVVMRWLDMNLKLYHVVGLGVLGVVAIFYVLRSGNMGAEAAGSDFLEMEKQLRQNLDRLMGVRPRFKEFMFAHPAMILAPIVLWRGWRPLVPLVLLAAATGQAGMADTFAHIHTPLIISLKRSVIGVACGAVVGAVAGAVLLQIPRRP